MTAQEYARAVDWVAHRTIPLLRGKPSLDRVRREVHRILTGGEVYTLVDNEYPGGWQAFRAGTEVTR